MSSDALFSPLSTTPEAEALLSDEGFVQAMLDTEVALATAQAEVGVVASSAAEEIRRVGRVEQFDITALGHAAVASGTPVLPMLERFRALLTPEAADALHFGATSQDILDTAAMLITRPVLDAIQRDLWRAATACASLAEAHRASVMLGRTLLQPAVPTTFGLKAAGWLVAIIEARRGIGRVRDERLAVQFGGAVGTLAAGGPGALAVVSRMAELLGMAEPSLPWHSHRARIAELGSGLAVATGALGKIALDVILLAQAEVGEVVEGGAGAGSDGRSSAMPQKRNPVMAVAIRANALRLPGLAATLFAAMAQEHERAAGAWQAEWPVIRDALALTAGAASRAALLIEGLEVDAARMRSNLLADGGFAFAEHLSTALNARLGRAVAVGAVTTAVQRARDERMTLREAAALEPLIASALSSGELDELFAPAGATGQANALIDRALARFASNP